MTFTERIETWNKKISPYHNLIGMLIFFIGGTWAIYQFIFKPSDLSVLVEKREINYPNTTNTKFNTVYKYLVDSTKNEAVKLEASAVYDYLINTQDFWIVTLKNESDKSIKNIKLRITNVGSVTNLGMSSQFLLEEETNLILKKMAFQDKSGIIYLDNIGELPRKASLSIYVWGKMPKLLLDENIFVTYEGGEAQPAVQTVVTGFRSYLANYIFEIFLIMLIVFIAVYIQTVNRDQNAAN
jgi:hypothetical protein